MDKKSIYSESWLDNIKAKSLEHTDRNARRMKENGEFDEVWNGLIQELDLVEKQTKKEGTPWIGIASIAAGVAILLGLSIFFFKNYQSPSVTGNKSVLVAKKIDATTLDQQESPSPEKKSLSQQPFTEPVIVMAHPSVSVSEESNETSSSSIISKEEGEDVGQDSDALIDKTEKKRDEETTVLPYKNEKEEFFVPSRHENKHSRLSFSASSSSSAILSRSTNESDVAVLMSSRIYTYRAVNKPYQQNIDYWYNKQDFIHYLPFDVCANIAYQPHKSFFIETGIHYTLLKSRLREERENPTYQYIHYVGVPISANFILFNKSGFNLYTGIGFEIDKVVSATLGNKNIGINPWQFGVSTYAGISYSLSPLVQLYLAPGIKYYLDDKTRLQTYFKAQPLNFSISIGVRFTPRL